MYLKNYTSEINADVTISRVERLLVNAGATGIQKLYTQQVCSAIIFEIEFDQGKPIKIRLPANIENCLEALWTDYTKTSLKGRKERADFADQAERTAWKLVQDWVEVQVSLIQLKQVESLEVFMPYVWDGKRTFFEMIKENNYKALLGTGKGSA